MGTKKSSGIIFIVALVLLNIALLYQNSSLKASLSFEKSYRAMRDSTTLPDNPRVNHVEVDDRAGNKVELGSILAKAPYTLVVYFSPSDCGACLEERALWNQFRSIDGLQVIGVSPYRYADELDRYIRNSDIRFPVYRDSVDILRGMVRLQQTPAKILLDSRGELKIVDYVRADNEDRKHFLEFIADVAKYGER